MTAEFDTAGLREESGGAVVEGVKARRGGLSLRRELIRKSIHAATVLLPLAVWVLPYRAALALLLFGAAAALLTEAARRYLRPVRYAFLVRTRHLLRPHERRGFAGATWMAVAYLLAFLLFPLPIAVAAMLYNGLGDAAAAIIGRRWGRRRLGSGKSWEGFAAATLVNVGIGLALPGIPPLAAVAGGIAAAALEIAPLPIDDNVAVTVGGGAALWALALTLA